MIKNIIIDFGRVLVDYDFLPVIDTFFPAGDEARKQQFCDLYLSQAFTDRCDLEDIPFAQLIAEEQKAHPEFARELGMFRDRYQEFVIGQMPGMQPLLERLKAHGLRLFGLTNWSSEVYKVIDRYPIFQLLDGRVISSEEHIIKPDRDIYLRLCDRYALNPAECLFVDDKAVNVEGARRAGMDAVVFTTAEAFEKFIGNID